MLEPLQNPLQAVLTHFTQTVHSGGIYTPPGNRLLLAALAVSLNARDILETGYDAGAGHDRRARGGGR